MRVELTTNPGIEDVVEAELRRRAAAAGIAVLEVQPEALRGRVQAELDCALPALRALTGGLRSVHHVLRPLARIPLDPLDPLGSLHAGVAAIDAPELDEAASFRVTAERRGEHAYTSIDVQKVAGSAVRSRRPIPVSMKDYALELRVEVEDDLAHVAVQHTRQPLSRREVGPYHPRTALRSTVAYALLALGLGPDAAPATICDPCCGSGTVLLEAAALYPDARLLASDRYEAPLEGCRANLDAAGLLPRATLRLADARALAADPADRRTLDAIITNPPYGLRLGAHIDFDEWYHHFLLACAGALRPGGRLGLLALRRKAFNRALERVGGLDLTHVRVVGTGGAWPGLFVLERL